jgi:hypothetical protein
MSVQYGGDKITFADGSTVGSGWTGMKNRIINGDMRIAQRTTSALTVDNDEDFPVDRTNVRCNRSGLSATSQQSSTAPTGFNNSIYINVTTGASASSTDRGYILQKIEGYNVADLMFGTANATPMTFSFWVRSSLTGTFSGAFQNNAQNRSYVFTYTISSANTWEKKTISLTADTTGTWDSTSSAGLFVKLDLGMGSSLQSGTTGSWISGDYRGATGAVAVFANSGATFYTTGWQLEKGSTATSFDYRPYGTELALCQRYYASSFPVGNSPTNFTTTGEISTLVPTAGTGAFYVPVYFPVSMRASPTIQTYDEVGDSGKVYKGGNGKSSIVALIGNLSARIGTGDTTSSNELTFQYTASAEL